MSCIKISPCTHLEAGEFCSLKPEEKGDDMAYMPRTFTLVRHGDSESNAAKRLAKNNSPHRRERDLVQIHTSRRRLTPRGVEQAINTGAWLREYFIREAARRNETPYVAVRGFVSPYVRTMETAGHFGLPIVWRADARLTERNWGDLDQLTHEERIQRHGLLDNREHHGIFWSVDNSETLQMLSVRMWQHFNMLIRKHTEHDVIEVSHGDTILVQRFMLERWLPEDVVQMMLATNTRLAKEVLGKETDWQNKMINCRIVQYTRERADGTWDTKYCRVRLIAPSAPDDPRMNLDWRSIGRREFTSEDLLQYAEQFPRFL